jgi:glucans biosynthesis protein
MDRRSFVQGSLAAALAGAIPGIPPAGAAEGDLTFGKAMPMGFDLLKERAKALAGVPYAAPVVADPSVLQAIDYDAHGRIRYRTDRALFQDGNFPVTFFHPGRFFQKPVRMHVLENGEAREILYDPALFSMPADSPARRLPRDTGFAGFRFQESRTGALDWQRNDWVAFLGASYFRAIGELYQYGLSARGVAVDTVVADRPEEFPDFTHVYFERPGPHDDAVTVLTLLDGPSITGAFRFRMRRTRSVVMEVSASLNLRRDVARLGIAPLTSMYWFSETAKPLAADWRPEVHDSDGLSLWTGTGERAWRAINNPPRTVASAFADERPRGFGLMQRDRLFDHYQDGVHYQRRPSLWVEPMGDWGKGAVQLVENRTDDEIHDNVVAMWVPAEPARAGASYAYDYRLHWVADEPFPSAYAEVVATRMGNGGEAGKPRPKGVRKFAVEFLGEALTRLRSGSLPEPVVTVSRGEIRDARAIAVPDDVPGHWRVEFDVAVEGADPVELRLFLRNGAETLTETWLYQYHPEA